MSDMGSVRWGGADRCTVMGILNVTPDSFSDGGRHQDHEDAVTHGLEMWADGADVIDVGGESTRPGASRVPVEQELLRVVPVVADLASTGVPVSVDTTRRVVAEAAVAAGAVMVNDVSGGRADPSMIDYVASAGVRLVLAHSRGPSLDMVERADYRDVVAEVVEELAGCVEAAREAGVAADRIVVDPGLGFAKRAEHNWALLGSLERLGAPGYPVLVGASRKAFLGELGAGPGAPRPTADRDELTAAVTAVVAGAGAWGVRVHDVARSVRAAEVAAAMRAGGGPVCPVGDTGSVDAVVGGGTDQSTRVRQR